MSVGYHIDNLICSTLTFHVGNRGVDLRSLNFGTRWQGLAWRLGRSTPSEPPQLHIVFGIWIGAWGGTYTAEGTILEPTEFNIIS